MMPLSLAIVLAGSTIGQASATTPLVDFSREVRPILSRYCFQCHGPDDRARKAHLRLDERASAVKKLRGGGHALVPGRAMESEMFRRVTATDETVAMPPAKLGKRPTAQEGNIL